MIRIFDPCSSFLIFFPTALGCTCCCRYGIPGNIPAFFKFCVGQENFSNQCAFSYGSDPVLIPEIRLPILSNCNAFPAGNWNLEEILSLACGASPLANTRSWYQALRGTRYCNGQSLCVYSLHYTCFSNSGIYSPSVKGIPVPVDRFRLRYPCILSGEVLLL